MRVCTRVCRAEVVEALKHSEVAFLSSQSDSWKPNQVRREPFCPRLLVNLPHQLGGGQQISPDGNISPAKTPQQPPLCLSAPLDAEGDQGSTNFRVSTSCGTGSPSFYIKTDFNPINPRF